MQDEEFYDACRNGRLEDARAFQREADPNFELKVEPHDCTHARRYYTDATCRVDYLVFFLKLR